MARRSMSPEHAAPRSTVRCHDLDVLLAQPGDGDRGVESTGRRHYLLHEGLES
jgi:hypothetical protein